ncbi:MAG: hypothetical protein IPN70_04305 [Candidatus Moraniibacteriota bacterium]|nr:MAG: hypothetical protein IPN70_04305 [Candidatus Moranbacteria bacterium]
MKIQMKKASVLAFTLIMMGVLLLAGLSLSEATLRDRRTALDSGNSLQALQIAESVGNTAIEKLTANTSDVATIETVIENGTSIICSSGPSGVGTYDILFYKINEIRMECGEAAEDVAKIKVYGKYRGTARVIDRAIAK